MNIETLTKLFGKARISSRARKRAGRKEKEDRWHGWDCGAHLALPRSAIRKAAETIIDDVSPFGKCRIRVDGVDMVRRGAEKLLTHLMHVASLLAKREGRITVRAHDLRVASHLYGLAADEIE